MSITLTFSKTAYYKAIFARLAKAVKAAIAAYHAEIQNHRIHNLYSDYQS
jgi:hypothetical protein